MAEAQSTCGEKGRGVSWTREETRSLIALRGEERVQEQLHETHRNIDVFKNIAVQLRETGHKRTVAECRTKSKVLRKRYYEVAGHNSQSCRGTATMPFFKELHSILGGDATIHPKRVAWSTSLRVPVGYTPPLEEGSQEPGDTELLKAQDSEKTVITLCLEEQGIDPPSVPFVTSSTSSSLAADERHEERAAEPGYEFMCSSRAGTANHKASLPPAERLAEHRRREHKMTARDTADCLMDHSATQMMKLITHLEQEEKEYLEYRWREEERQRLEDERASRDRERLTSLIEVQTALFSTLVQHITSQGSAGRKGGHGQPQENLPSLLDAEMEFGSPSPGLTPQPRSTSGSRKAKAARQTKQPTLYSPSQK